MTLTRKNKRIVTAGMVLGALLFLWAAASPLRAQQQDLPVASSAADPAAAPLFPAGDAPVADLPEGDDPDDINPNEMLPLVLSYWEHVAISDARNSRGLVRPPTEEELMKDLRKQPGDKKVKPPPEEREINLEGIVFRTDADWTIWLNGKRVTPTAVPREVIDLKVYKEYVEMKWFDDYSNQIFPIRLRPHQRFNIDTRIFLPG